LKSDKKDSDANEIIKVFNATEILETGEEDFDPKDV
jgi:hypothetical protein